MLKRKPSMGLAALAILSALACSHSPTPAPQEPSREIQNGVLGPSTVLISSNSGSNPIFAQTEDSMTFQGQRNDLAPGKVIVSTFGRGALRRIVSTSTSGGNTVVQTTQAALTDAFESLKLESALPFDQTSLGDIQVQEPGLTITWVTPPGAPQAAAGAANALSISFNKGAFGVNKDFEVNGTYTVSAAPTFKLEIDKAPGRSTPSLKTLTTQLKTTFNGTISLKSTYGGSITGSKTWFDKDFGTPVVSGPLVWMPHLKIESSISGTAAGSTTYTASAGLDTSAQLQYTRGAGWSASKSAVPTLNLSAEAETELGVRVIPISVELSYNLYGLVGPYASAKLAGEGTATHTIQNSVEGVQLEAKIALEGEAGVAARVPDYLKKVLDPDLGAAISVPFDLLEKSFSKFIPYSGSSSIVVMDNGTAPDDIFSVSIDGTYLGQTSKGGTGSFRVTRLRPGQHTLSITCLDDGANGANIGTLGISLSNGFTFSGGATTLSDSLSLNQTKTFTVVVPAVPARTPAIPPPISDGRE